MAGLYLEELKPGLVVKHALTKTITESDNMRFSVMTLNPQPLHIDRHFCETQTEWGQPIMNSLFTLGLTTIIDLLVVFLFTKPVVTLLARTRFFSGGSKWSGLSVERLGGRTPTPVAKKSTSRTVKEA